MKKATVFLTLAALLLPLTLLMAQANDVFVRDILDTPQRYYNLEVTLQGEVVDVQMPADAGSRGYYVLMDNSDKKIKVVANTLPAPQTKLAVTGVVQIEPQSQEAYIRETNRMAAGSLPPASSALPLQQKEGLSPTIIALIALIGVVVIVLIIVLMRKPKSPEMPLPTPVMNPMAGVPAAAPEAPAPASAGPIRTKQVSYEDVNRAVGGIKTKQVPHILAELKIVSGSLQGKAFPLKYETTIGRVNGDIALEDASVSGDHARIIFVEKEYVLENLSQTNPTIVNGERVTGSKALKPGDELIMGVIKMKFQLI